MYVTQFDLFWELYGATSEYTMLRHGQSCFSCSADLIGSFVCFVLSEALNESPFVAYQGDAHW